jgi:hypothetical protein
MNSASRDSFVIFAVNFEIPYKIVGNLEKCKLGCFGILLKISMQ